MPFGLKNAPATFQRLMDRFRSGLKDVTVVAYLDDILVISENLDGHLQDLQQVFDRLRQFNLKANRNKCVFAREKITYLGHVITVQGIEPDPMKIRAIVEMLPPSNLKELKSFLQTCSWFRKFIPHFSEVAQPLSDLTKKNKTWKWAEKEVKAFNELKRRLTTSPILRQPDFEQPFILRTDASACALGAVLVQGSEPKSEKPIEYASRLLTAAERNYSTTEREALAVVWALDKFRGYLEGAQVRVATDHQPLKWLLSLKRPSGRLARWALKIQAYNLETHSRPVCQPSMDEIPDSICDLCPVSIDLPHRSSEELRAVQQDIRKDAADTLRRPAPKPRSRGDLVLVDSHRLSQAAKGFTSKFAPRREGPYRISKVVSATTYEVEDKESESRGKYHASLLTPYVGDSDIAVHGRKRGRPRKVSVAKPAPEPSADLEGEDIVPIPDATLRTSRLRRLPVRLRD